MAGENGPWLPHPGYVIAGYQVVATGIAGPLRVSVRDGAGRVYATIPLSPVQGEASGVSWGSVAQPADLYADVTGAVGTGRVTVEAVQRRIEAYYGSAPDRLRVGALANRFGAVLRGEWLERNTAAG